MQKEKNYFSLDPPVIWFHFDFVCNLFKNKKSLIIINTSPERKWIDTVLEGEWNWAPHVIDRWNIQVERGDKVPSW